MAVAATISMAVPAVATVLTLAALCAVAFVAIVRAAWSWGRRMDLRFFLDLDAAVVLNRFTDDEQGRDPGNGRCQWVNLVL